MKKFYITTKIKNEYMKKKSKLKINQRNPENQNDQPKRKLPTFYLYRGA